MSGVMDVAGRVLAPAGWDHPAASLADGRGMLLTVIPARDGRALAIVGYVLPPQHGVPADPAKAAPVQAGLVIDREGHRVFLEGREIELVFQEFELLEFLTARPSRALTREEILAGAWANRQQVTNRTVDVHIHRLRRKLGPDCARSLVTVRRVGYMYRPAATS
jgi:DNA-binding response OmpR family regulator